jgi:2-amino-4-hydroxy-6-hydroxymethyldihydropteridine diphosphokinase
MPESSATELRAYVGMGSNLGDRACNLLLGVRGMLASGLRVVRLSSIYETEPFGVTDQQPAYLNMVAELAAPLPSSEELLAQLLDIEHANGRTRTRTLEARTLDLDLLLYGDERRASETLTLPHPRLHLRRFVLVPLVELAPDALHPALGLSYAELLAATDDRSDVRLWKPLEGWGDGEKGRRGES